MTAVSVLNRAFRSPTPQWRTASWVVMAAYLVLVGEAVHCRYFVDTHDHHGTSQSQSTTHAAHCIAANHGSAVIPSIAALGLCSLPVLESVSPVERIVAQTMFTASAPARAPPSA